MTLQIKEVTDLEMAFESDVMSSGLLPPWAEIPNEFKDGNEWTEAAAGIFYSGAKKKAFHPKDGVDAEKAFRMVRACLGSFEPQHEHKIAGVGYMLSEFFEKIDS